MRTVIHAGLFHNRHRFPQNVHPPTPADPSRLGQVKGNATGNLYTFSPYVSL